MVMVQDKSFGHVMALMKFK